MWGAARHDRATGIHQPLQCDVLVLAPLAGDRGIVVRAEIDLCGLAQAQHHRLVEALSDAAGVPLDQVILTYSHTHAGGWYVPDRIPLPGGELIADYLLRLEARLREAAATAMATMQEVTIEYAVTACAMTANRDYWDEARQRYACGYNPDAPADTTLIVGRISGADGTLLGSIVNYGCHPTTLAWENSLISPDYVGSLRQLIERETGQPCIFLLGACGDLGPRDGFVGDPAVAERNGRQVAYAALSALSGLGPPGTDYAYEGPVESGATLGVWRHVPAGTGRQQAATRFQGSTYSIALPLKDHPDPALLRQQVDDWEARARVFDLSGDLEQARDCAAYAERARRRLAQLGELPAGTSYLLSFSVHTLGDAIWVTCGGEPYAELQLALRRRFPFNIVIVSPLSGDMLAGYLLPTDRYGIGLYQEEPSLLAPGCLETLIAAIATRVNENLASTGT
jgi:hypothetical protein